MDLNACSEWLKYPENKPTKEQTVLVIFKNMLPGLAKLSQDSKDNLDILQWAYINKTILD